MESAPASVRFEDAVLLAVHEQDMWHSMLPGLLRDDLFLRTIMCLPPTLHPKPQNRRAPCHLQIRSLATSESQERDRILDSFSLSGRFGPKS